MSVMFPVSQDHRADLLVTDRHDLLFLVVEVKRRPFDDDELEQTASYSQLVGADFAMAVDPHQIRIAKIPGGVPNWRTEIALVTKDILKYYDEKLNLDRVESFYLEGLIKAWLRDYSFSWKSKTPPGYAQLDRIGMTGRLRQSDTHSQNL